MPAQTEHLERDAGREGDWLVCIHIPCQPMAWQPLEKMQVKTNNNTELTIRVDFMFSPGRSRHYCQLMNKDTCILFGNGSVFLEWFLANTLSDMEPGGLSLPRQLQAWLGQSRSPEGEARLKPNVESRHDSVSAKISGST